MIDDDDSARGSLKNESVSQLFLQSFLLLLLRLLRLLLRLLESAIYANCQKNVVPFKRSDDAAQLEILQPLFLWVISERLRGK